MQAMAISHVTSNLLRAKVKKNIKYDLHDLGPGGTVVVLQAVKVSISKIIYIPTSRRTKDAEERCCIFTELLLHMT